MNDESTKYALTITTSEATEISRVMNAGAAFAALWDIAQEVFRPARKHGYSDPTLQACLTSGTAEEMVSLLENRFYEILTERSINLND